MRVFGPKTADHPSIGVKCIACHIPFKAGDYTTLVALGPGNDPEQREKSWQGKPYTAVATEIHQACRGGEG